MKPQIPIKGEGTPSSAGSPFFESGREKPTCTGHVQVRVDGKVDVDGELFGVAIMEVPIDDILRSMTRAQLRGLINRTIGELRWRDIIESD